MNSQASGTQSFWTDHDLPGFTPLQTDASTDVVVIGAGIAGLTTAFLLQQAGKNVIVVDEGDIASGESARTTAHISNALDDRYYELERMHGNEGARLAAQSHSAAIDKIESLVRELQIDCDFERVSGYLFAADDDSSKVLENEQEAAEEAGLNIEWIKHTPLPFPTGPCLHFPQQAQFHPLKYLSGLATALTKRGGKIYTQSHVESIESGKPAKATLANGVSITAGALIVATNTPINDRYVMHTKQAPYRSYVIGVTVPKGSVAKALYWDTAEPYHYVRIAPDFDAQHDLLIVGGEDHKTGQADDGVDRFSRLLEWTKQRITQADGIHCRWSGQVMEPVDGLAFIGRNPLDEDNVYIATGDSGNGITHGTIAGMLISDLVLGRANPWTELYSPRRKSLRALGKFTRENVNVAAQFTDWLTPGDIASVDEIALNSGGILRDGTSKYAVYRNAEGVLHKCNAKCPHLGCVVAWNDTEKSWDCPCHGSRFAGNGDVISGPSKAGLEKLEVPAER